MLSFKILFVFKFFAKNLFLPPQCALSVHILSSLFRQVCLTGRRTFTFGKCSIRIVRITFQCFLFPAAKVPVIMVYRSRISTRIHASLYGALKIEIFWANILGLRLFITVSLPIGKTLRTWTNRIRRFRWVKDSRIAVWTYTFSTKRWKLDVGFLKMQWTRFLDRRVSWIFYLLAYRKLLISYANWAFSCRKAKIIEVRRTSFLTPITAKSNSTTMTMVHVKITCKGQKNPGIPNLSNAYGFSSLFALYSPEPRFGVGVSLSVSHAEIYQNWAIGFVLGIF